MTEPTEDQPASSTVRIDRELLEKAQFVLISRLRRRALKKRMPVAQYLDSILRPQIDQDYQEEIRLAAAVPVEKPRKKPKGDS